MKAVVLSIASLCVLASSAWAVEKQKELPDYIKQKQQRRADDIKVYDANKDGVLQPEELQKSRETKFNALDKNQDGIISPDETAGSLEKFKQPQPMETSADKLKKMEADREANRIRNQYKLSDENKDGKISKDEYQGYMSKQQQFFDRNGDGVVSQDEYRAEGEKIPGSYQTKPRNK